MILEVRQLVHRYSGATADAVTEVDLTVDRGELVGIVGPNGSGKTTLLKLLGGVLRPSRGEVLVDDRPIGDWSRAELARTLAVVSQREEPAFPMRVEQTVMLGRYPYLGSFAPIQAADRRVVSEALDRCDVGSMRDRWTSALSGGEWQRVRIARALAQQPRILMLDEATANLDVRHEMQVFELTSNLVRKDGVAAVVVTHHVNLAARFVDRLVIMDRGAARSVGPPAEVLTKDVVQEVFEWPVAMTSWDGRPQFVPLRQRR